MPSTSEKETNDFACGVIYACGLITETCGELGSVKEALGASGINSKEDCIKAGAEEYDYDKLEVYWS